MTQQQNQNSDAVGQSDSTGLARSDCKIGDERNGCKHTAFGAWGKCDAPTSYKCEHKSTPFDCSRLDEYFLHVARKEENNQGFRSFVLNDPRTGSFVAQLTWLAKNELRIYIHNFSGQKLYYTTNFPIRTLEEFKHEMRRIRLAFIDA